MGMIFKVAAGVLLGLLAYNIIVYQNVANQTSEYKKQIAYQQAEYEKVREQARSAQSLKSAYVVLVNSITSYYRKNKSLPKFISDLRCISQYRDGVSLGCAALYNEDVFYANYEKQWVSAEPYIFDGRLYYTCRSSISLSFDKKIGGDCLSLDVNLLPKKILPPFKCKAITDMVERLICASDKLIALEVKLSLTYKDLLEQNPADKKQGIMDDKNRFIQLRRKTCVTSDCVEEMTLKKISRLKFLGVWKKG